MKNIVMIFFLITLCDVHGQNTPASPNVRISNSNVLTLNSNFILPITRFNFYTDDANSDYGKLLLFNSLGAGLSLNYGRLTETVEEGSQNENIDQKFANAIGLQLGVLFSADLSKENPSNVFAPTVSLSILDFQIGWGFELGTRQPIETRHFVTVSYGIPIQKLTKKGTWTLLKWIPQGDSDNVINVN